VTGWSGVDSDAARTVLRRAEQSVSDWEANRDLPIRDLVLYLIVDGHLRAHPERHGARSRMARTVRKAYCPEL
jgi:hypothetical protein